MQIRFIYKNQIRLLILICTILHATCALLSCASNEHNAESSNIDQAYDSYTSLLGQLRHCDKMKAVELTSAINSWQTLRDSLYRMLWTDSSHVHDNFAVNVQTKGDSIRTELIRLASTYDFTLKELSYIKRYTTLNIYRGQIRNLQHIGDSISIHMDEVVPYRYTNSELLYYYNSFLDKCIANKIRSDASLDAFLAEEDRLFRTFLTHINEWNDMHLAEITTKTKEICDSIYHHACTEELGQTTTLVKMVKRTSRRLIQNAEFCIQSIQKGDKLDNEQRNAYQWMLLQPFYSIDNLGIALLSEPDYQAIVKIAERISHYQKKGLLFCKEEDASHLPNLFLKLFLIKL